MKLMLYDVDNQTETEFTDGEVLTVACESKRYFSKLVACAKGISEKEMALVEGEKELSFIKDAIVLIDYYDVEAFEKSILTKFYKRLDKKHSGKEETGKILAELRASFVSLLKLLTEDYNLDFDFSIPEAIADYAKFLSLRPRAETADLAQSICGLIEVLSDLQLYSLLILVTPSSFFTEEERAEIAKACAYSHQKTLFLEDTLDKKRMRYEKKILIDEDFYDIMLK